MPATSAALLLRPRQGAPSSAPSRKADAEEEPAKACSTLRGRGWPRGWVAMIAVALSLLLSCLALRRLRGGDPDQLAWDELLAEISTTEQTPPRPVRPCGVESSPRKRDPVLMSHAEFFGDYKDVSRQEAQRYSIRNFAGRGSYGIVVEAVDVRTGKAVAIKKMVDVVRRRKHGVRNLRELKLLRLMKDSEDIIHIQHVLLPPDRNSFTSIYFVMEKMDTTMKAMVKLAKKTPIESKHLALFQMLRGLHFMHKANVYHRDIKPNNILVNNDCKVKLIDLGLSRPIFNGEEVEATWSGHVGSNWYRPPELVMAGTTKWTHAMDVWNVGLVFLQLLSGKPVFNTGEPPGLAAAITDMFGTPGPEVLAKYPEKLQGAIRAMPQKTPANLTDVFPMADSESLRVAATMLDLDPESRPSPQQMLNDRIFRDLRSDGDTMTALSMPISGADFDFSENRGSVRVSALRRLFYDEALLYHQRQSHKTRRQRTSVRVRKTLPSIGGGAVLVYNASNPCMSHIKPSQRENQRLLRFCSE